MISLKIRFFIYLLSVATIFIIGFSYHLFFNNSLKKSGTNGFDILGLKLQIQLQQVSQPKTNIIVEKEKLKNTKSVSKKKDELAINKKKEDPKKQEKPKKKKIIVKQQKRIYDKGRIGKASLIYAHKLSGFIQRNMIIPKNIYKNYKVLIRFRINANGEVVLLNIKKSSGSKNIDKIALRTIRNISPFPKPPFIVRKSDMTFVIPMEYKLQ